MTASLLQPPVAIDAVCRRHRHPGARVAPQSRAASLRSLARRVGQVPRAVCGVGRSREPPRMAAGAGADQVGCGVAGVRDFNAPFAEMWLDPTTMVTAAAQPQWIAPILFAVWACGFAAIVLRRVRQWREIRAAVRASTPAATTPRLRQATAGSRACRHRDSHRAHRARTRRRRPPTPGDPPAGGDRFVPDRRPARRGTGPRGLPRAAPRQPHGGDAHAGGGALLVPPDGVVDRRASCRHPRAGVRRARRCRNGRTDRLRRGHCHRLPALCGDAAHGRGRCRRRGHQGPHRRDSRQPDRPAPDAVEARSCWRSRPW